MKGLLGKFCHKGLEVSAGNKGKSRKKKRKQGSQSVKFITCVCTWKGLNGTAGARVSGQPLEKRHQIAQPWGVRVGHGKPCDMDLTVRCQPGWRHGVRQCKCHTAFHISSFQPEPSWEVMILMGFSSYKPAFGWNHEPQGEVKSEVLSVKPLVLELPFQSWAKE